jgi:hypothetical protein
MERREGVGGPPDLQVGQTHAPEGEMHFTVLETVMPDDVDRQEVHVLLEQEGF